MRNRMHFGVALFCFGLFSVAFIGMRKTSHVLCPDYIAMEPRYHVPLHLRDIKKSSNKDHEILHKILKDERNKLSKGMNDLRKKLGQQECEVSQIYSHLSCVCMHVLHNSSLHSIRQQMHFAVELVNKCFLRETGSMAILQTWPYIKRIILVHKC